MHTPPGNVHRSIWNSPGLLGEFGEPEEVGLNLASFGDVSAWELATVLADWKAAPRSARELDRITEGAGGRLTDKAVARTEALMPESAVG